MTTNRPPEIVEHYESIKPELLVDGTSGTTALQADKAHVYLEWVGQPSPFDSIGIQWMMIGNKLSPKIKRAIREMAAYGVRRVNGSTRRILEQRHIAGLSQDYIWGPNERAKPGTPTSYIQIVTHRDAELIKASDVADEFRILGMKEQDGDRIENEMERLLLPTTKVTLINEQMYRHFTSLEKDMGWR